MELICAREGWSLSGWELWNKFFFKGGQLRFNAAILKLE